MRSAKSITSCRSAAFEVRNGTALGDDFTLAELRDEYDAVFIGLGLAAVNELGLENEDLPGVESAIDYIAELRQSDDLSSLPVGSSVLVVGGGMTAIDIAVQSKRLGAEQVTIRLPARRRTNGRQRVRSRILHRPTVSPFATGSCRSLLTILMVP